jgi:hypothetical protein
MKTRKSKLRVDGPSADDYLVANLSGFICSPLDTPKGLGRGYFFSYDACLDTRDYRPKTGGGSSS